VASDANGPGSTPGGTLELVLSWVGEMCIAFSKQLVTAVEDCEYTVTLLRMKWRIVHIEASSLSS